MITFKVMSYGKRWLWGIHDQVNRIILVKLQQKKVSSNVVSGSFFILKTPNMCQSCSICSFFIKDELGDV